MGAALLEVEGHGRLGEDHQLRPLLGGPPDQALVPGHGLPAEGGVPLLVLGHVALEDRHPDPPGPPGSVRSRDRGQSHRPVARDPEREDGEEARGPDRERPPAPVPDHPGREPGGGDEEEAHAVDAGHVGDLDHREPAHLAVPEGEPGEPRQDEGAHPLDRHPERGEAPDPALGAQAAGRGREREHGHEEGQEGGEEDVPEEGEGDREVAVDVHRAHEPVEAPGEEPDPRDPSEQEASAGRASLEDDEERRERDPGQDPDRHDGEREREPDPAARGQPVAGPDGPPGAGALLRPRTAHPRSPRARSSSSQSRAYLRNTWKLMMYAMKYPGIPSRKPRFST